ncbi:hypothetical protein Tco_0268668 [Tanacetum coccineum]
MLWEWRGIANMDFIKLGGSSRVLSDFCREVWEQKQGAGWFWYWREEWEKGLYKLGCDRERLKMIKGMFEHAEFDESNAYVLERFYTSAGNPVKEILLKLNLPDHRILKDGGEVLKEKWSSCDDTLRRGMVEDKKGESDLTKDTYT